MKTLLYGIVVRIVDLFVKADAKHWVFAANYGKTFNEGPRNLMMYVMRHDPTVKCLFVTRNRAVRKELKRQGIPCVMNCSMQAVLAIARAGCVFSSHAAGDIFFAFVKQRRRFFYLMHGQAFKKGLGAIPIAYWRSLQPKHTFWGDFKHLVSDYLVKSGDYNVSEFASATSEFVAQYTRKVFPKQVEIKVLGSPRCDSLFIPEQMENEFFDKFKGKMVVTYMPTHRLYGKGVLAPMLFKDNKTVLDWLRANDVVVLIKQHPNMIPAMTEEISNDVVIDITKAELDLFCTIYHSDVLVSDYSSVWMDYLLLRRPLIHFFYDSNYNEEDEGYFYDLHENPAGHVCDSQEELFEALKRCRENYSSMCPSEETVRKFHKYVDGNSCKRHYEEIIKDC
ncbi:CDP-glycerol--glycerophosphate glycerophosphotransferase [Paraprevotella clara]|uniref:CDP-glycerol:poly(Glycerophosphate) glycerophosphotransferase n=1 Tax=Paraprevotella clara YIT 11840 TaxID=762968 RepID=G5SV39_9BACT|nr:CDP-glycerol--glycerophosphate glycerophosphotransferase [Paraprevotella clara]EHG98895.1 CDP-glycerol:poly(glycerophosphate) glycerophosphotransferase [Paraprevotella clara YIT 11840]